LYDQALDALNNTDISSEITIGVPDDYAFTFLPNILNCFVRSFPSLRLTIVCEPSRRLSTRISQGTIDLALMTEGEGIGGGIVLRREDLTWVTSAYHSVHEQDPVPIAIFHSGDVFRRHAIQLLEERGRRARVVVNSMSFAGIHAALQAGIVVAAISAKNVHPALRVLTERDGFPVLPSIGIILQRSDREPRALIDQLVDQIVAHERRRPGSP
jgi:DNA-binding transcriptional LysR family regulator